MSDTLNNKVELVLLCAPHLRARSGNNSPRNDSRFEYLYLGTVIYCIDTKDYVALSTLSLLSS